MSKKKILVLAGSARTGSVNKKLAAAAAAELEVAGASVTLIDLANFDAPVYNGDIEADSGIPATMQELRKLIKAHDAMFITAPEYNACVPPVIVNVCSWVSRPQDGDDRLAAFAGKYAAIGAASPGAMGGMRMLPRLRDYLAELGLTVIPGIVSLPGAMDAFDDNGNLLAEGPRAALSKQCARLVGAI